MAKNNFKLLLEEDELNVPVATTEKTGRNLTSNLRTFSFFGNVIDLYLPRVFDTMIHFAGADQTAAPNGSAPTSPKNNNEAPV